MWLKELQALEKTKKIRDPKLDEMIPPVETAHVCQLYWQRFRATGISYQELKAFEEIEGYALEPWEIDLLFTLHNVVENTIGELTKARRNKK